MTRSRQSAIPASILALLFSAASAPAAAPVLGRPFGDGMVVQSGRPVPVWGTAATGTAVTVEFGGAKRGTVADAAGRWRVVLDPFDASAAPRDLVARGSDGESAVARGVRVGEVWLCAGQSNMRFALAASTGGVPEDAADPDLVLLDFDAAIRGDNRRYDASAVRALDSGNFFRSAGWRGSTRDTASGFSAVAWHFGRRLRAELKVPVGLILVAVGGAPIESFLPRSVLESDPVWRGMAGPGWLASPLLTSWCRERAAFNLGAALVAGRPTPHHPYEPGFLYAAGIEPLAPCGLRGVAWYQGESNATTDGGQGPATDPAENRRKLEALIAGWRHAWGDPALPFLMVQLPGLNRDWAAFRQVQLDVARATPHCGLAVTIDAGHPTDVHPRDKRPVGDRLARQALRKACGRSVAADGPLFRTAERRADSLVLRFDGDGPFAARGGGTALQGFEAAGADGVFKSAIARLEGGDVVVRAEGVAAPVAVRYAWGSDPKGDFVGADGLPASPFAASLPEPPR